VDDEAPLSFATAATGTVADLTIDDNTGTFAGATVVAELTGNDTDGTAIEDTVIVQGSLDLTSADTLELNWLPGADATSKFGGSYTVAEYGGLAGDPNTETLEFDALAGNVINYVDTVNYDATATDVVLHDLLDGDADLSGSVGFGDFNTLLANWNASGDWFDGDFDFSGTVGFGDFNALLANWNDSVPSKGAPIKSPATVPEPATLTLLGLGGLAVLRRRRKA
jgi:hypothetical protein